MCDLGRAAVPSDDPREPGRVPSDVPQEHCAVAIDSIKKSDIIPLKKPSEYFIADKIPILGSGKVDLKSTKELAREIEAKK